MQIVLFCCLLLCFGARRLSADAIVITKAMQASTIAEIFVDQHGVRVELEIAKSDWPVFQDLLPSKLYAETGKGTISQADRYRRFFQEGLLISDQRKIPLVGSVEQTTLRQRIARDEVTGYPLPEQPSDAEQTLHVILKYNFNEKPERLSIQPPLIKGSQQSAANIGFVCYHNGLPVNDFRYMPGQVTLDLDWSDPWYSHFQHPNLRKQFNAPMSVYLYVEPYEVRKEIIVRPKDLQTWIDLGVGDASVIPVKNQEKLKKQVAEFLSEKNPVSIDGKPTKGRLDRIHFIRRTLRSTGIVEPPVELDMTSATLGIIYVYPVERLPEEVSMTWELFNPRIQELPAVASDEAGGLPSRITKEDPVLLWKNYLTNPANTNLATIQPPQSPQTFSVPFISVFCAGLILLLSGLMVKGRKTNHSRRKAFICCIGVFMICGFLTLPFAKIVVADPFAKTPDISNTEQRELMSGLLYNTYRAFDHHDESLIYDRLAESIAGELLSKVYLETRASMEVKNQGGLRISVKDVTVTELKSVNQSDHPEITLRCRWRVAGWIGHWGHIHRRINEHIALVTIAPLDGKWKINAIEMLDEQPLEPLQKKAVSQEVGSK
ncbi:MAG: hypothetical protein K0U86_10370 [Planctomycetes bacterium]|nr:hypothetical protein [Planctomycetota bacterium]MCH9725295.1 hypothetical protein [Planctomycetota bacterium]MCH9779485.1 hypothetical protein [Planctomycetota bacterium]